jgi:hypothetical protein
MDNLEQGGDVLRPTVPDILNLTTPERASPGSPKNDLILNPFSVDWRFESVGCS